MFKFLAARKFAESDGLDGQICISRPPFTLSVARAKWIRGRHSGHASDRVDLEPQSEWQHSLGSGAMGIHMRRLAQLYNELLLWAVGEQIDSSNGSGTRERVAPSTEELPEGSIGGILHRREEENAAREVSVGHLYAIGPLWLYVVDRGVQNRKIG